MQRIEPERQGYYQGRVVTRKGFPHEGEYALYTKKDRKTVTKYFKNKKMADEWAEKSGKVGTAKVHKYVQSLPDNTVVTRKLIQDFLDKNNLDVHLNNLFNKKRTSYIGDHITNKTVTVDPSYKASFGVTKQYKKTKEILNNPQLKNKLIKFANKPGVSARDVWTKFNISETEWNRGGLSDIISKDFKAQHSKFLKPKTVKNMLLLHNHKEAKEFIRKGLIIPDEIIEKLGLKAGEAATATVRLGQQYGGQDFMIKDLNTIRRNSVASDKIFTALNKFKFGNPYRAKLYRTALETIDSQLGNERGTFESLKNAARHILKKNKIKGFDINEIAGVTGSAKSKAVEFSQFIDIMDRNLNQKTLANFQGQLSIARQNIENNPNMLSSESKRINKLSRNLEDVHDIKLPRLRDPDAAKYFSPKRLKELEAQGLDIVKAAERAGYTVQMPKGAVTVKEFTEQGSKAKKMLEIFKKANIPCIKGVGGNCTTPEDFRKGFNQLVKEAADGKGSKQAISKLTNFTKSMRKLKGAATWTGYGLLAEAGFMVPFAIGDYVAGESWKRILGNATDYGLGPILGQSEQEEFLAALPEGSKAVEGEKVLELGERLTKMEEQKVNPGYGRIGMDKARIEKSRENVIKGITEEFSENLQPFLSDTPFAKDQWHDRMWTQAHQEAADTRARIAKEKLERLQKRREEGTIAEEDWMAGSATRGYADGGIASLKKKW